MIVTGPLLIRVAINREQYCWYSKVILLGLKQGFISYVLYVENLIFYIYEAQMVFQVVSFFLSLPQDF